MYLVWLMWFNPSHIFTGYVEVNAQAPSKRDPDGKFASNKVANPDLMPSVRPLASTRGHLFHNHLITMWCLIL